jgi:hypothetical protein
VNSDSLHDALDRYLLLLSLFVFSFFLCGISLVLLSSNLRFAQFFIKPLMSPDATLREIKAVDSGKCYLSLFWGYIARVTFRNSNLYFPVFCTFRKSEKPFIRSLENESGTCIFQAY